MTRKSLKALKFALAISCVILLPVAYLAYRANEIERLSQIAHRPSTEVVSVNEIGQFKGDAANMALLAVALDPNANQSNRIAAIRILTSRTNTDVSGPLSRLMQPHNGLDLRRAVSDSLQRTSCSSECVERILQYEERMWFGEKNFEDYHKISGDIKWGSDQIEKEQNQLHSQLDLILIREASTTVRYLTDIYGLGNAFPSDFAVDLVGRLKITVACPLLRRSWEGSAHNMQVQQKLQNTITSLNCP